MKISITISIVFALFLNNMLYSQSDTVFNQTDSKGQKQGFWKKYYPNGKLMYSAVFKNDKPVGEMKRYFESGNLKAVLNYDENKDFAKASLFFEDGVLASEGYYLNSKKDSTWKFYSYYNKNVVAREFYKDGFKNGISYCYYNSGETAEKLCWKNGVKEGIWEQYFEDGSLKLRSLYANGKLSGEFIVYQAADILLVKGSYLNDLPEGLWIFYNEDGIESDRINYVNGKPQNEAEIEKKQIEYFRKIDNNIGRFNEPDQDNFFPQNRNTQGEN